MDFIHTFLNIFLEKLLPVAIIVLIVVIFGVILGLFLNFLESLKNKINKFFTVIPKDNFSIFIYICLFFLLFSTLPLPYGFYVFNRLLVTTGACLIIYKTFKNDTNSKWIVVFGIIALLFNPFIPIPFDSLIWRSLDLIIFGVFLSFLTKETGNKNFKKKILAIIFVILFIGLPLIALTQNIYDDLTNKPKKYKYLRDL